MKKKTTWRNGAILITCSCKRAPCSHLCRMTAGRDVLFGHEIPFPLSDLVFAVATVAAFLPTVCLVHWTVAGALRLCQRKARVQ